MGVCALLLRIEMSRHRRSSSEECDLSYVLKDCRDWMWGGRESMQGGLQGFGLSTWKSSCHYMRNGKWQVHWFGAPYV